MRAGHKITIFLKEEEERRGTAGSFTTKRTQCHKKEGEKPKVTYVQIEQHGQEGGCGGPNQPHPPKDT